MSSQEKTTNNNLSKDVEIPNAPTDSISSISFSPQADFLAVGSWDNNVRIYQVGPGAQTQGKAMYTHEGPVLNVCWSKDGTKVLSGGADNAARMFDLNTGQTAQVAQHDAPIKAVRWIETPQGGILATGSWDKTLKYWDLRSPAPISTVQLPERCYSMDVVYPLLAVGTAERQVQMFDLSNPTVPLKTMTSPLKLQTRAIACLPSADGFTIASTEGRVGVEYLESKTNRERFTFRCHQMNLTQSSRNVYAVNDLSFHPVFGTVSTCGSDGVIHIWDLEGRCRLKSWDPAPGPITATAFNRTGSIFAYAVSYDWHKGHTGMQTDQPNRLMLHSVMDAEVKSKSVKR